jgi:hypothetical protein
MHRHDLLRARLSGTGCTVCGAAVDIERIRVLAERDDLAFLELPCDACGTAALGIITILPDGGADLDPPWADAPGSTGSAMAPVRPPLGVEDVRDMARFLAGYRGDMRGLLGSGSAGPDAASGPTR